MQDYQALIHKACTRVYAVARRTALDPAPALSRRLSNRVWLKREDQQPVFSYKLRGAYFFMSQLPQADLRRGVIAASAGNHAQGVALAARRLRAQAVIVMPRSTPEIKVDAVRELEAEIILHGDNYDQACEKALQEAARRDLCLVPPYGHPWVIAGQATVGVEILKQHPAADVIFVPMGGGGLAAGIAAHVCPRRPGLEIIGVEPAEAPCVHEALRLGRPVRLDHIGVFADGAAVAKAGEHTFEVLRRYMRRVLLVSVDEICAAVRDIFEDTRSIPEPAGALALAGLKQYVQSDAPRDRELVAVLSGANVNFDRLRHIAELAALGEHQEALLAVTIPERKGSFRRFCRALGERQITEFNYRCADPSRARVFVGVRLRTADAERHELISNLRRAGYEVQDLSANELAKVHVRYMVGGRRAGKVHDEHLYRFEFPERSGALLGFLDRLGGRWNISLFHYRNHGAAYGRVLMGIQVPEPEYPEFQGLLKSLEIPCWEESDNPAYELFLS